MTDVLFSSSLTDWTGVTSVIDGRGSTNDWDMSLAHRDHPTVSMAASSWLPVSGEYVMLVSCLCCGATDTDIVLLASFLTYRF
jgi:hypothetical protein